MRPTGRPAASQPGRSIPDLILKEMQDQTRYEKRSLEVLQDFGRAASAIASGMPRQSSAPDLTPASTVRTPTATAGQSAPSVLPAFQQVAQPILQHLANVDRNVAQMMQSGPQASRMPTTPSVSSQRPVALPTPTPIAVPVLSPAAVQTATTTRPTTPQTPAGTSSTPTDARESPILRSLADTVRTWFTAWQARIATATGTQPASAPSPAAPAMPTPTGQPQGLSAAAAPWAVPMSADEPGAIPGVPASLPWLQDLARQGKAPMPLPSMAQASMPSSASPVPTPSVPQPTQIAPVPSLAQASIPAPSTNQRQTQLAPAGAMPGTPTGNPAGFGVLVTVLQDIAKNVSMISAKMTAVATAPSCGTAGRGPLSPGLSRSAGSGPGGGGGLLSGLSGLSSAFSAATGMVGAAAASFTGLTYAVGKFVGALNPSQMLVLNRAFYDLQAAIGVGLTPIISGVTEVVRQFGSIILPMMQSMKPVVSQITDSLLKALAPIFTTANILVQAFRPVYDVIGGLVEAIAPVIALSVQAATLPMTIMAPAFQVFASVLNVVLEPLKGMGQLLAGFSSWMTAVSAIGSAFGKMIQAWAGAIGSALGIDLKSVFSSLRSAMEQVAKYAILAAANLAKFLGMDSFVKGLQDSLGANKKPIDGLGAAQNANIGDIQSFGRRVMESALLATEAGDPKQTEEQWRLETLAELRKIDAGQETSLGKLNKMLNDLGVQIVTGVVAGLKTGAWTSAKEAAQMASKVGGFGIAGLIANQVGLFDTEVTKAADPG